MPITNVNSGADKGTGRTTFRPPWVKGTDAPQPTTPWSKRNSITPDPSKENGQSSQKDVKLQSREVKVPVTTTTTKKAPVTPLKKKEVEEEKKPSGSATAENQGKFVRPVLKKVAKVEESSKPPSKTTTTDKKSVPVGKSKAPVVEESSEEEEESSYEEVTETETETESESDEPAPPPTTNKRESKSAPEKTVSEKVVPSKQVTLKPIPEKTVQPKPASESKIQKPELKPIPPKPEPVPEPKQIPTKSSLKPIPPKPEAPKSDGTKSAPPPPPPPPSGMGPPPPPPPPPGLAAPPEFERKPMTEKHKQMLEKLKTRPRRRPDWSDMMKEVESGRKLKHVQCNDRSSPIISCKSVTNIQGQYIFETEKANVHNVLLKQIQGGVRLKPTKTNDRSRPILEGLRKFRRQMTIEEQIQKSESRAQLNVEVPVEESEDEMDDIDKLRDDLQSTKQMLALELRNKEAQERENKRLAARVQILEAELEREKWQPIPSKTEVKETPPASEALLQSLKKEAEEAQKTSKLLEKKYQEAADQLDAVKNENERQKITIANLERRLAQQGGAVIDNRRQSEAGQKDSSPEPELELSEEEEDEDEEKKAERAARRLQREVKMMCTKLIRLKDKERAAKRERENLRDAIKKNEGLLKIEHKKFKKLQREVDKMAAMMKDDDEGNGSDDETKPPAEDVEEEEEEESEEEDEEESDSEDESEGGTDNESESEAEDATDEDKKSNYEPRIKRHDGRVSALKKGNYLLQANVDRLQDEINKMREKSVTLQRDLDSVLSELG